MDRNELIKKILPKSVVITPKGIIADELNNLEFIEMVDVFFDKILEISQADISMIEGYGEFDDRGVCKYSTCEAFLIDTFSDTNEGYWFNWKEMYETTALDEKFFNEYYKKMIELKAYCEGRRFLVNNNTFFEYMITDKESMVGFPDWTRSGITDFLLDIVLMDLNKPYLLIPEKFVSYIKTKGIVVENFKERFLCMAYYKGIDTLRWHASIDDLVSCKSIMKSLSELENRIMKL